MKYTLLAFLLLSVIQENRCLLYPLHASCKIDWLFGVNCTSVNMRLVSQIKKWTGFDECLETEKCGYTLKGYSTTEIKATHTTPVKHYVDDLKFSGFTSPSGSDCKVHGESSSETWYAVLDYGTNYCNLHNLITGSGLDTVPNYKETTNNGQCTQYSSANCAKYYSSKIND